MNPPHAHFTRCMNAGNENSFLMHPDLTLVKRREGRMKGNQVKNLITNTRRAVTTAGCDSVQNTGFEYQTLALIILFKHNTQYSPVYSSKSRAGT
jgi:hypothetical protein